MSIPIVTFFNNKGGVGKTSLVYHLAWMYAELDVRILAADLDPQANLTAAFLDEDVLEELWTTEDGRCRTIFDAIEPLIKGIGDIDEPQSEYVAEGLYGQRDLFSSTSPSLACLPGSLALSRFEDDLSEQWPKCLDENERAFRVTSAFWRILQAAAAKHESQLILVDIGPNLGAINRSALIASDHVVIPVSADLFSLQGLRNLGPTLRKWRQGWRERLQKNPNPDLRLPSGSIEPAGYIVLQHAVRLDRPVKAYERWAERIPLEYRTSVLEEEEPDGQIPPAKDPHCLALLKHYRSLMPLAQDAGKPIFHLKPADGAIGGHSDAVQKAFQDFRRLAVKIAERIGLDQPGSSL